MKKVLVLAAMAMFIGSSFISFAQEPEKTETPAPADSTKQEITMLPTDTVPTTTLTAEVILASVK